MRQAFFAVAGVGILVGLLVPFLLRIWHEQGELGGTSPNRADNAVPTPLLRWAMPARPEAEPDGSTGVARLDLDEQSLMAAIRARLTSDPRVAEVLARKGRERFPNSSSSDERDMELVLALFNQQKIENARSEAYYYLAQHPDGRYARDMAKVLGTTAARKQN